MTSMVVEQQSSLSDVVAGVQAYFTANAIDTSVAFEYPERDKQINQGPGGANRVVFLLGDDSGNCGEIIGAVQGETDPENPRSLFTWEMLCRVSIWGYDQTQPTNRVAHVEMAMQLFKWVVRAVQSVAGRDAEWGSVKRTAPIERAFGTELVVDLKLRGPLPDITTPVAYPTPAITPDPAP